MHIATADATAVRAVGTRALLRCDDDIRVLQLEVAELQRKLFATQVGAGSKLWELGQRCRAWVSGRGGGRG